MDEKQLQDMVTAAVVEALAQKAAPTRFQPGGNRPPEDLKLAKRIAEWAGMGMPLPPALQNWLPDGNRAGYLASTPARLGVGRSGVRPRTETYLQLREDHAAARDAVSSRLDENILKKFDIVLLNSAARDNAEFLRRPDLGRRLNAESVEKIKKTAIKSPQIQIVLVDGLSATALNVNIPAILPLLLDGFKTAGIRVGTVFAVSRGRVVVADEVARATGAECSLLLVGERPGLKTAESMGGYVTYMKVRNFNEAMRDVTSNIHSGGLPCNEAAPKLVEGCIKALRERRTGVDANG
ncbi:MAG TPA: ethanolamine ammonia-lyase subunit EutC [Myxococcota bacterium]|nr:ethanolamine ammonia-lyase subunit EutC [Myxococcota bacterium]HNZ03269.1 ethanolamine ammonia-lyase subunit EutC [Myxococcota bacterium]HOD07365.1 ethanolamine ammonia-lyase subunit EutC [Myxococcota bacterium]HPB50841.1 ethanolamine ammonia-lyase subunit EutC [Myxococcota bacterium]HQP95833.1 ethanolamine ammonia-lyase subunit EutC [Myxococcota bacterium]